MSETDGTQVAYGDALDAFPDWQSLTRVSGWDIRRGRVDETQRTGTGTATIYANDLTGYLGAAAEFPTHARISLRGFPRFRGHVDTINIQVAQSAVVSGVTRAAIECVDLFDHLSRVELIPGVHGIPPASVPKGQESYVVYGAQQVDDRLIAVLSDAGVPSSLRSIFSGNVNVMTKGYQAGTTAMQVLDETADSEWPGVANRFMNSEGIYCFRGRFARFNPDDPTYEIDTFQAGTGSYVTTGVAQIRELEFTKQKHLIYNAALCYPEGMAEDEIPDMIVTDATSIATYGVRSWSAENLLTLRHNANGNTGADECFLFSSYQIENYAEVVPRVSRVVFKSLRDSDPRAAATWDLMCNIEIGDVLELTTDWISGRHFVEGMTIQARELDGTIPMVTMALDLSPEAYWTVDPF